MKALNDAILRNHYDVIVIGAGLGGLTAASLLAKRGLTVLMIDQQNKPGGSCTSFKREDVVYDVGTAMIYGFGEKGFRPFGFLIMHASATIDPTPFHDATRTFSIFFAADTEPPDRTAKPQ